MERSIRPATLHDAQPSAVLKANSQGDSYCTMQFHLLVKSPGITKAKDSKKCLYSQQQPGVIFHQTATSHHWTAAGFPRAAPAVESASPSPLAPRCYCHRGIYGRISMRELPRNLR